MWSLLRYTAQEGGEKTRMWLKNTYILSFLLMSLFLFICGRLEEAATAEDALRMVKRPLRP